MSHGDMLAELARPKVDREAERRELERALTTMGLTISRRDGSRHWNLCGPRGLICVTVYRKGAVGAALAIAAAAGLVLAQQAA